MESYRAEGEEVKRLCFLIALGELLDRQVKERSMKIG
jgi:hypothetical protein